MLCFTIKYVITERDCSFNIVEFYLNFFGNFSLKRSEFWENLATKLNILEKNLEIISVLVEKLTQSQFI